MPTPTILETHTQWCQRATVRNAHLQTIDTPFDWRFPPEMKPLLGHTVLRALPEPTYRVMCLQYFYKYLNDVCLTETDVVNEVSRSIACNTSAVRLPAELAVEALPIIIDESFHSYMARLFALEIERSTGVAPMALPSQNQLVRALALVRINLAPQYVRLGELLCCAISESTFTLEILEAARLQGYDPRFRQLMVEHLRDEGRHCNYFKRVLTYTLQHLHPDERAVAEQALPAILSTYFSDEIERRFDQQQLTQAGLAAADAERLLDEVQHAAGPWWRSARCQNARNFLASCGARVALPSDSPSFPPLEHTLA